MGTLKNWMDGARAAVQQDGLKTTLWKYATILNTCVAYAQML
jgi:hypothetical protein